VPINRSYKKKYVRLPEEITPANFGFIRNKDNKGVISKNFKITESPDGS